MPNKRRNFFSLIKNSKTFSILVLLVIVAAIPFTVFIAQKQQEIRQRASINLSCASLYILASADKVDFKENLTLPSGSTKYYLKAVAASDHNILCSTNFSVMLPNGTIIPNWGAYKSGTDGVARIDVEGGGGTYKASFRPRVSNGDWSNQITVIINNSLPNNYPEIHLSDYLITTPGYVWIYDSINYLPGDPAPASGTTRIQTELPSIVCGVNTIPWRFTKESVNTYWMPCIGTSITSKCDIMNFHEGKIDLRWPVVDPNFSYSLNTNYDNYFWVFNSKFYNRQDNQNAIKDIILSSPMKATQTLSLNQVPAYNLGVKSFRGSYYSNQEGFVCYHDTTIDGCPNGGTLSHPGETCAVASGGLNSSAGAWRVRIDLDNINIDKPNFKYSGEALRIDYYEGGNPLNTQAHWRETWYFVKNIGLVKIIGKDFNKTNVLNCSDDADCLNDTVQNPEIETILNRYYQNPTLDVSVSPDNISYFTSIVTTPEQGYYLKINPIYTGYLEAQLISSPAGPTSPSKWLWADNGLVHVSLPGGAPLGVYTAKYRVWIPNEEATGETRIGSNNLTFSNEVVVDLSEILPTSTNTPSPTRGPTSTPKPTNTPSPSLTVTPSLRPSPTTIPSQPPALIPIPCFSIPGTGLQIGCLKFVTPTPSY